MSTIQIPTEILSRIGGVGEDSADSGLNTLLLGKSGVGKTTLLEKMRLPLLVHSFDPGGARGLQPLVDKGLAIVNTSFEREDRFDSRADSAYVNWETEFNILKSNGVFDYVGTYVIDSLTTFSEALISAILRRENRMLPSSGKVDPRSHGMRMQDWGFFRTFLQSKVFECLSLPCDFTLTGHVNSDLDETTGGFVITPNVSGRSKFELPLMFDNVWFLSSNKDHSRTLLTNSDDKYGAKTRAPLDGVLPRETNDLDLRAWYAKAGYNTEIVSNFNHPQDESAPAKVEMF